MSVHIGACQYLFSYFVYTLVILTVPLLFIHDSVDRFGDRIKAAIYDHEDTFDFIVVGGGSSGAVVANRLSENFTVLLLEAGGEPNAGSYVPGFAFNLVNRWGQDWQFLSVPQKNSSLAMNEQRNALSRGISIGGTSNMNFLMYARGHPQDYNQWSKISNSKRWSYENVLKYFKKSENYECHKELDKVTSKYHSKGGYLTVRYPDYTGLAEHFIQAGKDFGYPSIDYNAEYSEGFSTIQMTEQSNGHRMGTFHAFIQPIRKSRSNLSIYKFSFVQKILFQPGSSSRVQGVEYTRHGTKRIAYAKKEIIISSGSIGSPKILMASGIGPKDHLNSLGIPVEKDLPVGQNLQDHISTFLGPFIINDTLSVHLDRDITADSFYNFFINGEGMLTSSNVQATAFLSSSQAKKEGNGKWADLQFIVLGSAIYEKFAEDAERAFNIKQGILEQFYENATGFDSFSLIVLLNRPKTRGEILLNSQDPLDPPLINPKYFNDEKDIKVFVEGLQMGVKLIENSTTFRKLDAHLMEKHFPGCEKYKFKSDKYFECFARHYSLPMYHPVGTCAMGKEGSETAVVNSELQVIGIENLRVIDASVMPTIVSANTNAACIMIGELGADIIKEKHLKTYSQATKKKEENVLRNEL